MTSEEAATITDFSKCDFRRIHEYYKEKSEQRKAMTKEEKLKIKEQNEKLVEEYGWCVIDGHKERIGNFKIEPPGLFRGRGDHPKQGKIKVCMFVSYFDRMDVVTCVLNGCSFLCVFRNVLRQKTSPSILASE